MFKLLLTCGAILLLSLVLSAQADSLKIDREQRPLHLSVQAMYQNGAVFQTNDFVSGVNIENEKINHFHAFALRVANRTTGEREWERRFLNPRYGRAKVHYLPS